MNDSRFTILQILLYFGFYYVESRREYERDCPYEVKILTAIATPLLYSSLIETRLLYSSSWNNISEKTRVIDC
jgi:hypothetical protein